MHSGLSRLFTAFTHYRDACNALRTPVSAQSRRGLDWMNFFIADVQAGFGAFVAGPIMIGLGNYGGLYMIIGGPFIVAMGWLVHPWGMQRAVNGQSLLPLRQ